MREITYAQAAIEAIAEEMRRDPTIFMMGQIVSEFADAFYPGIGAIAREFGHQRARPTGIIERFQAGAGVGAALAGCRPIIDMSRAAFSSLAYDEIFTKAGFWRYEHGNNGNMQVPVVFRMTYDSYGAAGAEHARALTGHYMRGIGLKVAVPTTPYDAKGLMRTAIRDDDPVVFMQHSRLFHDLGPVPEGEYTVPFGQATVVRSGGDCTVVAVGLMVKLALEAAERLQADGVEIEIIDPRTLTPLDLDTIVASVRKTHRLVVVDEDFARCGVGAEIGFQVQEAAFEALDAPVARVSNPNVPVPNARNLRELILPSPAKIADAVTSALAWSKRGAPAGAASAS